MLMVPSGQTPRMASPVDSTSAASRARARCAARRSVTSRATARMPITPPEPSRQGALAASKNRVPPSPSGSGRSMVRGSPVRRISSFTSRRRRAASGGKTSAMSLPIIEAAGTPRAWAAAPLAIT